MKRVATVTLLLALAAAATFTLGASDRGSSYKVRAIFDNAGFVIPGEDVKVAGVKVGKIDSMDITRDFKAVVVLDIQDPAYQDFRTDARCQVRPQSLIGEKFVECTPTQKRAAGTEPPPALRQIDRGEGEGQYLLPVENTEKAVDLDLLNNILRLPYRQRLSLVVAELGTGLAGRGSELNQVIRRADPALKEVDKVLALLASQNKVLSDLARDSDTALAPLAREREHVSGFIEHSSNVAAATAERSADLEADIERLPRFLQELRPTMRRIGGLSDEARPVFSVLGDAAPDINRLVRELGPFATAGIPAVESLGEAGKIGTPAMRDALPVTKDLRRFAKIARPVGKTAAEVLESFKKGRGVERLLDYTFYQVAAINGFDSIGHYLRARLILNTCSRYYTEPVEGCSSRFASAGAQAASATAASAADTDPILRRTTAALQGKDPDSVAPLPERTTAPRPTPAPKQTAPVKRTAARAPQPQQTNANEGEAVLDYLFGKDAG
ncbi:MAG TPA: MlaD family protein [Solirubrobacteraceae bacterium]|nr:MlaD family protein [Solirubrobacteraceae bacterium]